MNEEELTRRKEGEGMGVKGEQQCCGCRDKLLEERRRRRELLTIVVQRLHWEEESRNKAAGHHSHELSLLLAEVLLLRGALLREQMRVGSLLTGQESNIRTQQLELERLRKAQRRMTIGPGVKSRKVDTSTSEESSPTSSFSAVSKQKPMKSASRSGIASDSGCDLLTSDQLSDEAKEEEERPAEWEDGRVKGEDEEEEEEKELKVVKP